MGLGRAVFLAASQSRFLQERAHRSAFVRRAVSRFMPGEHLHDALEAAEGLEGHGLPALLTRLGENVADRAEAEAVFRHYLDVFDHVKTASLRSEVSVKLTQLGLDIDRGLCADQLLALAERSVQSGSALWIDMEQSRYTDVTLELARRARGSYAGVGVCVQAYLRRTAADVTALIEAGLAVRLVKGAYDEPAAIALRRKRDVDESYVALARRLLSEDARGAGVRAVFGTHDSRVIDAIRAHGAAEGLDAGALEFHLLYGIRRALQADLVRQGHAVRVLISYGPYWFPWYMRRLAERPANVAFVVKSMFRR